MHVSKPSGQKQQAPSKAKGTAGTAPRRRRMIGLPQQFKGGGRRTAAAPKASTSMVRQRKAMPEPAVIQQPKPVRQPAVIKPARPIPIQSDAGGGRGQIGQIGPRKLTSREKRRRDNALKSEFDEIRRQASKRRRRRLPIRQPRVAMPYNPAADDFGIGRPNVVQPYKPNPLVDNIINVSPRFNPSTTLTDRFNKQIQAQRDAFNKQNKNNLNQNRLQMQRNKGGDVKKYATGGLNKGMTKSRTKYGTVDNKKK